MLGHPVEVEPGFAEMEFGAWDGLTFAEVAEQHKDELEAWLGSLDHAPGGRRVVPRSARSGCSPACDRVLAEHAGKTVVVVSHVTPIKTLVAHALDAPLTSVFRMELAPASVTVLPTSRAARRATSRWPRCGSTTRRPIEAPLP